MASEEQEQDRLIDPLIDEVPVFDNFQMTRQQRAAFVTDVARKIDFYSTIAMRYGFADEAEMAAYIGANQQLRWAIKEERAIWFASENAETRARELARRSTAELVPEAANIAFNETTTPSVRLDAVRTIARIAGLDGAGSREAAYAQAEGTARFSVTINLPAADKTINITPAVPAIAPEC